MSRVIFHEPQDQPRPAAPLAAGEAVRDTLGRPLRDLRISVTDRCNFRCTYCMPREVFGADHAFLPQSALLTFEEITRVASIALSQGVRKIRLTGGEPLLRKQIEILVQMLAQLRTPDGLPPELTLTTNGTLLARKAEALAKAGLTRVTVSLDALDDAIFERMSDSGVAVATILQGIQVAAQVGLAPVKINMVVRHGMNDQQILPMARHFRGTGHVLRFIEYMDVGNTNGWRMDEVVTGAQIIQQIIQEFPLQPLQAQYRGEVANRWAYTDGAGEIGLITSVSQPFCGDCTRMRLSPEGRLFTCLFADHGHDLRALLRSGATDDAVRDRLAGVWSSRSDRYSEIRGEAHRDHKIEMSYIGG
ncbi:GTP 3',8-cyclase MoaA [Castellaniella sp. FW104-16D08]|uniref:GTP 3',8-cyclase MoaA n=1 Tax=unclassified Castellaniella TaxID=2617606 RepID=UPI0033160700